MAFNRSDWEWLEDRLLCKPGTVAMALVRILHRRAMGLRYNVKFPVSRRMLQCWTLPSVGVLSNNICSDGDPSSSCSTSGETMTSTTDHCARCGSSTGKGFYNFATTVRPLRLCVGCTTTRYCSSSCQAANSARHKTLCKKLRDIDAVSVVARRKDFEALRTQRPAPDRAP